MTDTLTGLQREALAAASLPRPAATTAEARASEDTIYALARRIEAFAAATPNLDPDTHRNLLVMLARTLHPGGPATLDEARDALHLSDPLTPTPVAPAPPQEEPMSRPRDLPDAMRADAGDEEHQAWIAACDKLNELLKYGNGKATLPPVTVNDDAANEFVDAIRYWGECLVQFRGHQTASERGRAWREAKHVVEHGRRNRRG